RRGFAAGEAVDADDLLRPVLDHAEARRVRLDEAFLDVPALHASHGAAQALHLLDLAPGPLGDGRRALLDDLGALEDVRVLEEVGLVSEHLLAAEGPLLVPGARQAQGLVPGRGLHGA